MQCNGDQRMYIFVYIETKHCVWNKHSSQTKATVLNLLNLLEVEWILSSENKALFVFCICLLEWKKTRVIQQQGTRQLWNVSELFSILRCKLQLAIYKTHNTHNLHSCTVAYFCKIGTYCWVQKWVFLFNVPRSRTPDIFAFVFVFQCGFVFECEFVFECGAQRRISLPECCPRAEDAFPAFAFLKSAVPPSLPPSQYLYFCISLTLIKGSCASFPPKLYLRFCFSVFPISLLRRSAAFPL